MDDVSSLHSSVTTFAEEHAITMVPAVPVQGQGGPEVLLDAECIDLPSFLNLARQMGAQALYLDADPFDVELDLADVELPQHVLARRGQLYSVQVAFVAGGVVHYWEHTAAWYTEWEDLIDANRAAARDKLDADDDRPRWLSEGESEALAAPAVEALLATPEFRAEKPGGGRYRFAQRHIPDGTDERVTSTVVRLACDRADDLTRQRYADIDDHYDQLAASLLTDPAFKRAGSAAARKQAAERFLAAWADGWVPPTVPRDELYARAQRLAKNRTPAPALY
ncbi:hypothetical protein [Micromonospora sp. RP3T]|uniref:hypothetical protein n=1 Tax=Micromonospora sp. RP3T TaxID=2135446 RepID=UPI0011B1F1B8|nr:hypothetical protein [Micromonospora sp. RP3T]